MKAREIVQAALKFGYENCGIIRIADVSDYAGKLDERIKHAPENTEKYARFYQFAKLGDVFPWAKSIVIAVRRYGKYRIPQHLEGYLAKYYMTDGRIDEKSLDYQGGIAFEKYLQSLGLKVETDRKFGLTALRWAAYKAGLGTIRRNNFFYGDSGSWVHLEAWLIDEEMELKQENKQKPCPENCDRCIAACPTQSLCKPYTMSMSTCVSYLTTLGGDDLTSEPDNYRMGSWIYGCDVCQDVCPYNAKKWENIEEYPGLSALSEIISFEKILAMDYETLRDIIQPKFWYVGKDRMWKWKINVLNAIHNNFDVKYERLIEMACHDENERVREMACWIKKSK